MTELEKYRAEVEVLVKCQKEFFAQGKTREVSFRLEQLKKMQYAVIRYEPEILKALWEDLKKSPEEGYLTEVSIVLSELKMHIRKLSKWARPQKVTTPVHLWPSRSYTVCEPFGVALILSPWNYPFQLLINPLIGAISAGNCSVLKPSPYSPATNKVVGKIIREVFLPEYVCLIEGDGEQTQTILKESFDFIFYTGSSAFGKEVMQAAAKHLTPVVLELGGKSPCIVDAGCSVDMAAKRIVWGKLLNAGQTCIAPDYIFVQHTLEQPLIEALQYYMTRFYGTDASKSLYYPRIINLTAFKRLKAYLDEGDVVFGGQTDESQCYISPTIMRNIKPGSELMRNEIFGPILPILTYEKIDEALEYINIHPKPLALYYFGKPEMGERVIRRTSSGGVCINDVILHIANHNLPFGGIGNSGIGKYHGKYSFNAFSNERAVLKSSVKFDPVFKYVPFKYFSVIKKFL